MRVGELRGVLDRGDVGLWVNDFWYGSVLFVFVVFCVICQNCFVICQGEKIYNLPSKFLRKNENISRTYVDVAIGNCPVQ